MIIQGEAVDVMRQMDPESFDAIIADPPYSSGEAFRGDRMQSTREKYTDTAYTGAARLNSFTGDNRDARSFTSWCAEWLGICWKLCREGSPVLVFTDWRQLPAITDAMQWAGFIWRGIVVWDKKNARPQKGRFTQACEFIVWGSKGQMPFDRSAPVLPGVYSQKSPPTKERMHQTEKPLALMRELVKITVPGGEILDPFAGSGTTNEAAALEGYLCTGIELDPHNVRLATSREKSAFEARREEDRRSPDIFTGEVG